MGLLYAARLGSFGLATITAIIAFGLSIHTDIAGNSLESTFKGSFNAVFKGSLTFAHLGIAAGVITLLVIPFLLLSDRPKLSPVRPLILLEVPIVSLLWILWISAGISTASFASANQDFHINGARSCDDFQAIPDARTICNDSKPTVIFDIATGAILLIYTAALVLLASMKSYGGQSIWSMTVKESEA
ncbi:hypothetical protein GSI_11771 [Ganoderma sinense ZZ0214-1]|uniref:MARVEL domain-containing protein n=1 Tax=Ganoderma sinense ZZ0214-1 TaxID=1077348 RepID=A0A2G8RWZ7_9APHY|nr:hypothetical protein GSI_11771 [Ganoderma sinense ZZ0214-1]